MVYLWIPFDTFERDRVSRLISKLILGLCPEI